MGVRRWRRMRAVLTGSLLFGGLLTASALVGIAGPASPATAVGTFSIATHVSSECHAGSALRRGGPQGSQRRSQCQPLRDHPEVEEGQWAYGPEGVQGRGPIWDSAQEAGRRCKLDHCQGDREGHHPQRQKEGKDEDHG